LLSQGYGTVSLHPFGLSFYNGLTGGLSGAERLGLELTYWNDAVDQVLLDRLARDGQPGATAALVPTLYQQQGLLTTNRALARARILLQDQPESLRSEWVVVSRRSAYLRPEILKRLESGEGRLVATRSRKGVWLSALWHFPPTRPADRNAVPAANPHSEITQPRIRHRDNTQSSKDERN
jgi:hypothetical protein